jgi:hypothetical protein
MMRTTMAGMAVLIVVVLALLAAAAVALLATAEAPRREGEPPVRAFRRGLRSWLRPDADLRAEARAVASARPIDVSLDQMLRANVEQGPGYLDVGELTESLHVAAAMVLPGRSRADDGGDAPATR